MLRLRANLKGTEHDEDPDSPRSPQRHPLLLLFTQCSQNNLLVTTATLTTGLLQSITTLSTHTHRWQAGAPAHMYTSTVCARTLPYEPAHSYCRTSACVHAWVRLCWKTLTHALHTIANNLIAVFMMCICQMVFLFSLWAALPLSLHVETCLLKNQSG